MSVCVGPVFNIDKEQRHIEEDTTPALQKIVLCWAFSALLILHQQKHDCQFGLDAGYDSELEKLPITVGPHCTRPL